MSVVEVAKEVEVGVDGVGAGGRTRCIEYSVDYMESVKVPYSDKTRTSTGSSTLCSFDSSLVIGFPQ